MNKRLISLLLAGFLLCSLLPVAVLAEKGDPQPDETVLDQESSSSDGKDGSVGAEAGESGLVHGTSEMQQITVSENEKDSEDLFAGFVKQQMGKNPSAKAQKSSGAGEAFTGPAADVYMYLLQEIHKIAIGQRASTEFDIQLSQLGTGEPIRWTAEELGVESTIEDGTPVMAFYERIDFFYHALVYDCAYDLYWNERYSGDHYLEADWNASSTGSWIEITRIRWGFCVDLAYQNGDTFIMNTTIGQRVVTAGNNARAVVANNARKTDYEKLRAYNRWICDAVSYDYDAANDMRAGTWDHYDPWQLIWAFDGDPTTNIVCAGYAKAFQHLCDLSTFNSRTIRSIIVSGNVGGGHMWNLVRMENGSTYLMDVTWSDCNGESGDSYEAFFLKGADGGAYPSYQFYGNARTYYPYTMALYGEEKLTISAWDYEPPPINIVEQPQSVTADIGTTVTFRVRTMEEASCQWYGRSPTDANWTPLDGETANILSIVASEANNGWTYWCLLQNDTGLVISQPATLTVVMTYPPIIINHPQNVTADSGDTATFTVEAAGEKLSYQWYGQSSNETDWTPLDGETANTLSIVASAANNGWRYFCWVWNDDGYELSQSAALDVILHPPVITTQPRSVTVNSGATATFIVKATAKGGRKYLWYGMAPTDTDWLPLDGETSYTLSLVASPANNGWQYCCWVWNDDGYALSQAATLNVILHPPVITVQPVNVTISSGAKASFTVKATGKGLSYLWYSRSPADTDWTLLDGQTTNVLSLVPSTANNGWQYYCWVWNDDGFDISLPATLTVTPVPATIKTQPRDVSVKSGAAAKFTVKASGPNLQYQWFERNPGDTEWTEIDGATKAEYTFTATMVKNGSQYYCRVQNDDGFELSQAATLTVSPAPAAIKTQPRDVSVKNGDAAKFTVKASGPNLQYQWFERNPGTTVWSQIEGANKAEYVFTASMTRNGWQYYCRIWNEDETLESGVATLTVTPAPPKFSAHPKNASVKAGTEVTFKVKASGKNVTYQWYYLASWSNEWLRIVGATGDTCIVIASEANNGWQYCCRAMNEEGEAWSKAATLKLK